MSLNQKRYLAYSFLEYMNNRNNNLIEIFVPLVERILFILNKNNITSGDFNTLKEQSNTEYGFNQIPNQILKKIMIIISKKYHNKITFYNDGAFIINNNFFLDFEDKYNENENEFKNLETEYLIFKESQNSPLEFGSFLEFLVENNNLTDYLLSRNNILNSNYSSEEKFSQTDIQFFSNFLVKIKTNSQVYKILKRIYIGSVITNFLILEKEIIDSTEGVNLIVDTNFLLSYLGLNSEDSQELCRKTFSLAKKSGYNFIVADVTLSELKKFYSVLISKYDMANPFDFINSDSPFSACKRNKFSKTDLQRQDKNIKGTLTKAGFKIIEIYDSYIDDANNSSLFNYFKSKRATTESALHDTILNIFVRKQRGEQLKNYYDIKYWILMDLKSNNGFSIKRPNGDYYENITSETLLSILWLANPSLDPKAIELNFNCFFNQNYFNENTNSFLAGISDNIKKYNLSDEITDKEFIDFAIFVSEQGLHSNCTLESLALAESKDSFIDTFYLAYDTFKEEKKQVHDKVETLSAENNYLKNQIINNDIKNSDQIDSLSNQNNQLKGNLEVKEIIINEKDLTIENQYNELRKKDAKIAEYESKEERNMKFFAIFIILFFCSTPTLYGIFFLKISWILFSKYNMLSLVFLASSMPILYQFYKKKKNNWTLFSKYSSNSLGILVFFLAIYCYLFFTNKESQSIEDFIKVCFIPLLFGLGFTLFSNLKNNQR